MGLWSGREAEEVTTDVPLARDEQPQRNRESRAVRNLPLHPPVVIADHAQLRAFVASRAFAAKQPLILNLPGMSPAEGFAAAEHLNKYRSECGCALGAQTMTAAFCVTVGFLMVNYGALTPAMLKRLPIAAAVGIISAAVGKIVGIAIGRKRARREVARILATFGRS